MKIHELKCERKFYREIAADRKNFEVRRDDRGFEVNDMVLIREIDYHYPLSNQGTKTPWETQHKKSARISFILRYGDFPAGIQPGYCILGLEAIKEHAPSW